MDLLILNPSSGFQTMSISEVSVLAPKIHILVSLIWCKVYGEYSKANILAAVEVASILQGVVKRNCHIPCR